MVTIALRWIDLGRRSKSRARSRRRTRARLKKQKVPSDPIPSLARRGHAAAPKHCVAKRCACSRFAPQKPFSPASASKRSSAPQHTPQWDRSLVTAFPSPATASAFTDSIPGSMVPACYFALSLPDWRARSVFQLHYRNRLAPTPAASQPQTRCTSPGQLIRQLFPSPLPSRSFRSLGIEAFNECRRRPVRLPNSPDFRLLPETPSIASLGLGSSFAIRYEFVGSLFLKPLGTTLNILLNLFWVNGNMIVTIRFQQLLCLLFLVSYGARGCICCG